MKRTVTIFLCLTMLLAAGLSWAITLNVSPNPAIVGQNVNISATTTFFANPAPLTINFGDGSPGYVQNCTVTPCTAITSHAYGKTGTFTVTASADGATSPNPVSILLFVQCSPLSIPSPPTLPSGTAGRPYSYQLSAPVPAAQSPVAFTFLSGSLPQGLNLSSAGIISGTPSTAGNYTFTVRASDNCPQGSQTADRTFTLPVTTPPCPVLSIPSPSTLPPLNIGQAFSYQIQTSGGQPPITFILLSGSLPPGLSLSPTGLMTGSPSTAGDYTFTVRASDNCEAGIQTVDKSHSIQVVPSPLTVTPIPSSIRIARGQSSSYGISYQFRGTPTYSASLTSDRGTFTVGDQVIETNPAPLAVRVQNGSGLVTDAVSIPVRIIERALQSGSSTFTYSRTFSVSQTSVTANVLFTITTEAGADFELRRIELYFDNRRPEITVQRNYAHLKAYAALRFTGSGLLQGYWEVDGRILSTVNQHLVYANDIVLETPSIPPLPTFDPGSHIIRFVVTSPATAIPLPSLVYFVTPDEAQGIAQIKLMSPEKEMRLEYTPIDFQWERLNTATVYHIEFCEKPDSKMVFSAYSKEQSYSLPKVLFSNIFAPGQTYYWKVAGFNNENVMKGESEMRSFTFGALPDHVQGQIMAVIAESLFSEELVNHLKERFSLTLSDAFPVKALNFRVVIFETKEDIFPVIDALAKDSRVTMVQPNYIFRTMADPKRRVQYANDLMKIDRIHEFLKGSGITIAVLDTGVDERHQELTGRVSAAHNFVRGDQYAAEIHGTAVAGIIAAGVNGVGIEGVAPGSNILALRACRQVSSENPLGECYSDSIARALDYTLEQKARVVNMSFGAVKHDNLISKLIEKGAEQGIFFVAPAGNYANERSLRFPASHPAVISVGGFDEQMRPFPNADLNKKTSVSAPAVNILTTVPTGKYNFMSGTSMSSAYISGILAIALEKDKSLTKDKLPVFRGDICAWEEELLKLSLCEK